MYGVATGLEALGRCKADYATAVKIIMPTGDYYATGEARDVCVTTYIGCWYCQRKGLSGLTAIGMEA